MGLRLDRIATLYIAKPLRSVKSDASCTVPILMYHSIAAEDESHVSPYYRTATSPEMFARQMAILSNAGYKTIRPGEALKSIGSSDSSKRVVITFDDGFRNFYQEAFPILSRHGFTATMYLATEYVGDERKQFKGKDCLTWSEVRELRKHGMSFGSHTVSHPKLYGLDPNSIRRELFESKDMIEQKLDERVESFAYPYAFPEFDESYKKLVSQLLGDADYLDGVVTTLGRPSASSNKYFLERLPVNSCDDEALFHAKLEGAYDWTRKPQSMLKKVKSWSMASKHVNY